MCLNDTIDGAMMMTIYTSKAFVRDPITTLYYSVVLTGITIVVSIFIALIQVLNLAEAVAHPTGPFWDGLNALGDRWDIVGGSICGLFLIVGVGSIFVYGPWMRRMEIRRSQNVNTEDE